VRIRQILEAASSGVADGVKEEDQRTGETEAKDLKPLGGDRK